MVFSLSSFLLYRSQSRGFGSLEIVIGTSLLAVVVLFTTNAVSLFVTEGAEVVERTQALYLAEEALEVARFWHDGEWAAVEALTNGTPYHLNFGVDPVAPTVTASLVEGVFTRTVTFSAVERNASADIVPNGTVDPDTRLVTATVSWSGGSVTLQTYLANIDNS